MNKNKNITPQYFSKTSLGWGEILSFMMLIMICGCRENKIEPEMFGALSGVVLDIDTGQPVEGALVTTNPASSSVLSAADGSFFFDNLPVGSATVKAEKTDYEADLEAVTIFDMDTSTVVLRVILDTLNDIPPLPPVYLNPSNGASTVSVPTAFRWRASASNSARYSILVFPTGSSIADTIASKISDTSFVANDLALGQQYFWQIVVEDTEGNEAFGPIWEFTTTTPPDNRVLFARNTNGTYSIWSCDQNATSLRQLTASSYSAWRPRWNPQRTKIAFLSTKSGVDPQIFTMNPDGTDLQQVTSNIPVAGIKILDLDFCWSPNGGQLLYMNQNRLYRINADGSGQNQFALAPIQGYTFTEVDWSETTNKVLTRLTGFNIYESIFIEYESNGTLISTVQMDEDGREGGPQYSILGNTYLGTRDGAGLNALDGRQLDARVVIRSIGGAGSADISWDKLPGTNDLDPRYSPTGAKVLFTNTDNDNQGQKDLYIMLIDGEDRELFLENAEMCDWR